MYTKKVNRKKKSKEGPLTPMEELLGKTLLAPKKSPDDADYPTLATKDVFQDKEFVFLYFSAVCYACEMFTPFLAEFYEKHHEAGKFQVVYVSSDKNLTDFDENFAKMPWLSITNDDDGFYKKKFLGEKLKIQKVPVMVLLQVSTGKFISNKAHLRVRQLADYDFDEKSVQKELEAWRKIEPVTLEEGAENAQIRSMWMSLLTNPAMVLILFYAYKWYAERKTTMMGQDAGEL